MKFTPQLGMILLVLIFVVYLMVKGEKSTEIYALLFAILVALLIWFKLTPQNINFEQARMIFINKAVEMQSRFELPTGNVYMSRDMGLTEKELIDTHILPDGTTKQIRVVVPDKWKAIVIIEGTYVTGYLFECDVHGVFLGKYPLDAPTLYSLLDNRKIEVINAQQQDRRMEPEERRG